MGKMLEALFGKSSRQITQLKNLLRLTVSRLTILRNQRRSRWAQAKADVAHLLLLGHHERALLRAEMVIKEQNMLDVFAIVESYCHLLTERASLLHNQKECPEELREAAAGLVFASSRCGDLPELREVRRIFSSRFGKEFSAAAAELRNNCGVSGEMVQKFSTRQPSLQSRVKITKEIAMEKGVKVDLPEPPPEDTEEISNNKTSQPTKTKTKVQAAPHRRPTAACDLQNILSDEKLAMIAHEKYRDAGSAAQAAFESAAYAAVAARTAVALYHSESQRKDSGDPTNPFMIRLTAKTMIEVEEELKQEIGCSSSCSTVDIGCRKSKTSSFRMGVEQLRGREAVYDEGDDDEIVEIDAVQEKEQCDLDLSNQKRNSVAAVDKMAIVAVKSPKRSFLTSTEAMTGRSRVVTKKEEYPVVVVCKLQVNASV